MTDTKPKRVFSSEILLRMSEGQKRRYRDTKLSPEEVQRRIKESNHKSLVKNKERIQARDRERWQKLTLERKVEIVSQKKAYYEKNKEKNRAHRAEYYTRNKEKITAGIGARYKMKRTADPTFRMLCNIRRRVSMALKGNTKAAKTMELVGCSIEFLRGYIEAKFEIGMTWENTGEWHLDHIIPCAIFDLSDPVQQRECFNFSNLQPLWAKDNFKKSDRLPDGTRGRYVNSKMHASANLYDY